MDASCLTPDAPLPDDVPTLHALVRQLLARSSELLAANAQLRAENAQLTAELTQLRAEVDRLRSDNAELRSKLDSALRHRFGRRSERRQRRQTPRRGKALQRRHRHGRAVLPAHLERREVVHDLSAAEKLCPCCGQPRVCIGRQVAEQLDLEPAKVFVRRTIRLTYGCQHCDKDLVPAEQRFQTAGPAQVGPIAKGLCGPGLLAHVITAKFADHTPLHRLVGQLARSDVQLAPATLGDWMKQAAELLTPLVELMHQRLLLSRVLHGDDTGVKLRVAGADRTARAHLWVTLGDADHPYVVFDFTADYTKAGPQRFLKGYKGYLQADALAQYEGLYGPDQVKHCCCWAHARRKFDAAWQGKDDRAERALTLIGQLYAIEDALPPLLPPAADAAGQQPRRQREEQRRRQRQEQAQPVLAELKKWLEENKGKVLPKSPLGQAIGYALNNWEALCRYLEQGYLAIDNNLSERTLRVVALGRNNWGVVGSAVGGQTAAVLYSVVQTCRRLGIDPFGYLKEALPGLFALGEKPTEEQLEGWLPDVWSRRRARDAPGAAAAG
jgi:transposase